MDRNRLLGWIFGFFIKERMFDRKQSFLAVDERHYQDTSLAERHTCADVQHGEAKHRGRIRWTVALAQGLSAAR